VESLGSSRRRENNINSNQWIEIRAVLDNPPEDWSAYINIFDEHGCPGTLQSDDPPALSAYMAEVNGATRRVDALKNALTQLGVACVQTRIVPEEDWSENWKQHFKTRRVGKRIVIRPTWDVEPPSPADITITLDPGQAFGTGDHQTTRICLQLLEQAELHNKTVADVGCGSGILAITAVKLGAKSVIASDIDEQSVEITKENAKLNGVEFQTYCAAGFDAIQETQDVVISNIISATLIRLAPDASRAVKPGGKWIVSGIIEQNWPDVLYAATQGGFALEQLLKEDEWVAATFLR